MTLYQYKAYDGKGKKISGVIEADSLFMAKERLLAQKILITEIRETRRKLKQCQIHSSSIFYFTSEMHQLLRAGLPLFESLQTIEEKMRGQKTHFLFVALCDALSRGESLSKGLKNYPEYFDEIYLALIEVGEQTGTLTEAFGQLVKLIQKRMILKKRLVAALVYPAFLAGFCLFVIASLLFFVIPSMKDLFEDRPLHVMTRTVIGLSNLLSAHLPQIVIGIFAVGGGVVLAFRALKKKGIVDRFLLDAPLLKTFMMQAAIVRFSHTFALLQLAGVPILTTLKLAKPAFAFAPLISLMTKVEESISQGETFSHSLEKSPYMPSLVIRLVRTGEETGTLGEMMGRISELYEDELDKSLTQISTLIQPVMLVILGGVIGLVLLSILLPLTDVSSILSCVLIR